MNSADGLKELMEESGISLDSEMTSQLLIYLSLLEKWNSRINLTSTTEWPRLKLLFQEGIWASKLYHSEKAVHLDIGIGAGFPAVLLRILKPNIQLDMVESRAKKCVFLETLIDSLRMSRTSVHCMRLRTYLLNSSHIWDCITWKALKLNNEDLSELRSHSHQFTEFWMFHGKQLAVEAPDTFEKDFKLVRSEGFDNRQSWFLSIYLPRRAFHVKQFPANSAS